MVDGAGADRGRTEAIPRLRREVGHILRRLRRPFGKQRFTVIPQRALQRHADAHPAVVVEIGVGDERERRGDGVGRSAKVAGRPRSDAVSGLPAPKPRRPQVLRQQRVCFFSESARLRLSDRRQPTDVDLGQRLLRPFVGAAGAGVNGKGNELLSVAEHLDRRQLEAIERRLRAINEQPLRCPADAQRRGFAKALLGERCDADRHLAVGDIDVDGGDGAAGDADGGVRPLAPDGNLVLRRLPAAVLRPAWIVAPGAADETPRLLGARHDRDDGVAVVDQARPEVGHEARHQNGTSGCSRRRYCSSRSASARK